MECKPTVSWMSFQSIECFVTSVNNAFERKMLESLLGFA